MRWDTKVIPCHSILSSDVTVVFTSSHVVSPVTCKHRISGSEHHTADALNDIMLSQPDACMVMR